MLSGLWAYIAGAASLVAVAGGLYLRGRSAGKATEQARQATETLASKERQDEAAAAAPRDRSGVAKRLRDGTF